MTRERKQGKRKKRKKRGFSMKEFTQKALLSFILTFSDKSANLVERERMRWERGEKTNQGKEGKRKSVLATFGISM
jgi:hypothetical protein